MTTQEPDFDAIAAELQAAIVDILRLAYTHGRHDGQQARCAELEVEAQQLRAALDEFYPRNRFEPCGHCGWTYRWDREDHDSAEPDCPRSKAGALLACKACKGKRGSMVDGEWVECGDCQQKAEAANG